MPTWMVVFMAMVWGVPAAIQVVPSAEYSVEKTLPARVMRRYCGTAAPATETLVGTAATEARYCWRTLLLAEPVLAAITNRPLAFRPSRIITPAAAPTAVLVTLAVRTVSRPSPVMVRYRNWNSSLADTRPVPLPATV
jgi:hypothetical protein